MKKLLIILCIFCCQNSFTNPEVPIVLDQAQLEQWEANLIQREESLTTEREILNLQGINLKRRERGLNAWQEQLNQRAQELKDWEDTLIEREEALELDEQQ